MLPPRASFNTSCFIEVNGIPLLEKFFPAGWSAGQRELVMHIDNAPTHSSRMVHNSSVQSTEEGIDAFMADLILYCTPYASAGVGSSAGTGD
jgi:hypothetical protein